MTIFPPIKELPKQYHILTVIRSTELKTRLAERITAIFGLLDFFDTVEPSDKTKRLVKGFIEYLNNTCTKEALVQRRSAMMLTFANVVYDHLLLVKHGPVLSRDSGVAVDNDEFTQQVEALTHAVVAYYARPVITHSIDSVSQDLLVEIIELSKRVLPDYLSQDYNKARDLARDLTDELEKMVGVGSVLSDDAQFFMFTHLREIQFYTNRFVSHKGAPL